MINKNKALENEDSQYITFNMSLTELGNSNRFVEEHKQDIFYCVDIGNWFSWDGSKWVFDNTGEIVRKAKQTILSLAKEADGELDEKKRGLLYRHAIKSQKRSAIFNLIELAKANVSILRTINDLDRDPLFLNCLNGTIDLRTGTIRQHEKEDLITKQIPITFDPAARNDRWTQFVFEIMDGDIEMVNFLQKALGYSITALTNEQVMFVLYGKGSNGKSVLFQIIRKLLGSDYYKQAQGKSITLQSINNNAASGDIARLAGNRIVSISETDEETRLNEGLVKQLTGSDTITARYLYKGEFEFTPQFKIWLATNYPPNITGTDDGIWRRIVLIPFKRSFTKEKGNIDYQLMDKLEAELPGILNWVIEGCIRWQSEGLNVPSKILEATQQYRSDMDTVEQFISESCIVEKDANTRLADLYRVYRDWSSENGEQSSTNRMFAKRLVGKGYAKGRGTANQVVISGLKLK